MRLAAFEACGPWCGVALADGERPAGEWRAEMGNAVAGPMLEALRELLAERGWPMGGVERFAACTGPGSFTGIKIAVTLAKTLGHALGREVVGVDSFAAVLEEAGVVGPSAAVMPSKRGWLYLRLPDGDETMPVEDAGRRLAEWTAEPAVVAGPVEVPGLAANFRWVEAYPSAGAVARVASRATGTEPAALLPYYVAAPSITKPKRAFGPR